MIRVVISGGQTGVDRAALDAARDLGVLTAGWCPKGRRASDDAIPLSYPLVEVEGDYRERTVANVEAADATLILMWGDPTPGTKLTLRECRSHRSPYLSVQLSLCVMGGSGLARIREWLDAGTIPVIAVLNVAGPSERSAPGVYTLAYNTMISLLHNSAVRRPGA